MSGRSPMPTARQAARCNFILQKCLAIQLQKTGVHGLLTGTVTGRQSDTADYWMYDNGYLLFQGFLEANSKCFWNLSLLEAMKELQFEGYVAQGTLLLRGSPCALEVLRSAWSRNVLKAPTNYNIVVVGDIEDCLVSFISQGQFTPLPEALCWVILELTSSGQHAVLDSIRNCLHLSFPDIEKPSSQVVYDTLSKLMTDKKIYQTSQGYFIVTPESRRLRPQLQRPQDSLSATRMHRRSCSDVREDQRTKSLLMTTEEALTYVHGEMTTIRDGDVTHQSIQTNLADVICGGNPNDRILYASVPKRSSSFPLERRNSLKLFGSNKRLNSGLTRSGSMKYIPHKSSTVLSDSSSSTDYQPVANISTKKTSLLARLFRRSGRKRGSSAPPTIHSFSAQFPPTEWFNPKVIHMHCVGTQTKPQDVPSDNSMLQWEIEPSARYTSSRLSKSPRPSQRTTPDSSVYFKPKRQEDNSPSNTDSLRRRQLYTPRRGSISKSSKSLNRTDARIYEEIKKSSDSFYGTENIYTKLIEKKARSNDVLVVEKMKTITASNPSTPKYKRKLEKRSSSLPRRKTSSQRLEPVTCTDFPYNEKLAAKAEEAPIRPNLTNRRSSSYENLHFEAEQDKGDNKGAGRVDEGTKTTPVTVFYEDHVHDMTSLTSSGYDTQTNSIVSCEQVPYALKISKNYLNSTTPPSSLTITEETLLSKPSLSSHSSRSVSPYSPCKPLLNVTSAISVTTASTNNTVSVHVTTGQKPTEPEPATAPRLERFPSLYSPREVLKTGYGFDHVEFKAVQSEESDGEEEVGRKLSDLDINSISTNQDEKFVMDQEKDDYGLSHKPIPRSFNIDFQKCDVNDSKNKKPSSKIPIKKTRVLGRPVSIDSSTLILRKEDLEDELHDFPSLSDLSLNFKSIAAQNILNNISVTSVDTLVEVNMAAGNFNDKTIPSVNFTTDFGIL